VAGGPRADPNEPPRGAAGVAPAGRLHAPCTALALPLRALGAHPRRTKPAFVANDDVACLRVRVLAPPPAGAPPARARGPTCEMLLVTKPGRTKSGLPSPPGAASSAGIMGELPPVGRLTTPLSNAATSAWLASGFCTSNRTCPVERTRGWGDGGFQTADGRSCRI
jgi:hypothetical protein